MRVTLLSFDEGEAEEDVVRTVSGVLNSLLDLMGVDAVAGLRQARGEDGSGPVFDVDGDDSGLLIGRKGESLRALQFLVNLIATLQLGERPNAVIDVAGYQARRDRAVRNMAKNVARKVVGTGRSIALEPMTPYERRLVHLALADNRRVVTESAGVGPERQVVVSPAGQDLP